MKKMTVRILLVSCLTCCALVANAFSIPPRPVPGKPGKHGAPFDGGVSLLIAAGVAYGVKKAYNKRKAEIN